MDQDGTSDPDDRVRRARDCEEKAVELIKRFAMSGDPISVDFPNWPTRDREDVESQLFRSIVESPRFAFLAALGYARAGSARKDLSEELERRTMDALRQAEARGYFCQPEHLRRLRTEADLDSVRRLPEFLALAEDVEANSLRKPGEVGKR